MLGKIIRQNQGILKETFHSPRQAPNLGSSWGGVPPVTWFYCKHCKKNSLLKTALKLDLPLPSHQIICHYYQVIEYFFQYLILDRNISNRTNGWTQASYESGTPCYT